MKKAKSIKMIIIGVVLAALVLGYYYYLSNRTKQAKEEMEMVQITEVQNVLMRDLENYYPPTPKTVLEYYCEITKCFYNEEYTDEELEQLAQKIQELYDDELIANKTYDEYIEDLRADIANMQGSTIASCELSASTDVEEYYTEEGDHCARMYCTFYIYKDSQTITTVERFVLRQDEDGHWKILGWELVDN